jgi:hypothetical protein
MKSFETRNFNDLEQNRKRSPAVAAAARATILPEWHAFFEARPASEISFGRPRRQKKQTKSRA